MLVLFPHLPVSLFTIEFYRKMITLVLSYIYIFEWVLKRKHWLYMVFYLVSEISFSFCYHKFIFEFEHSCNVCLSFLTTLFTKLLIRLHDSHFLSPCSHILLYSQGDCSWGWQVCPGFLSKKYALYQEIVQKAKA